MDRAGKQRVVQELGEAFSESGMVIVVHYRGLNVAAMTGFRVRLREAGASLRVAKNRLVKIALRGTPSESIAPLFEGPTAVAYSNEPVGVAKAVHSFAREHGKLVILGGAMDGMVLDAAGISRLATLPSLDGLRGQIVGLLSAPATKVVRTIAEPGARVARALGARAAS